MQQLPFTYNDINAILLRALTSNSAVAKNIIERAENAERITLDEVAVLIHQASTVHEEMECAAQKVRRAIYGDRMILFAPLYWSSYCANRCDYCGFRADNTALSRAILSPEQAAREARVLAESGYRRVLLESGEDAGHNTIEHLCAIMRAIYGVTDNNGKSLIDRVNVNIAATSTEDYRRLCEAGIGTYNLFQETYDPDAYRLFHRGHKRDYSRQFFAHDRAIEAGIGDVGLAVLWGLAPWKSELLALIAHGRYLEEKFGFGPHTYSVPRINPAAGVNFTPPHPVSDTTLLNIIAILRLVEPSSGLVISTRESEAIRLHAFRIGVTQTSAGSSTDVGGYSKSERAGQFTLGDHRGLEEVVQALLNNGFIPAFCTACEQRDRTGVHFARFARTGFIGQLCTANSLMALTQYLYDGQREGFIGVDTALLIEECLTEEIQKLSPFKRREVLQAITRIKNGTLARDEYI